jgi:hypothetical protein
MLYRAGSALKEIYCFINKQSYKLIRQVQKLIRDYVCFHSHMFDVILKSPVFIYVSYCMC